MSSDPRANRWRQHAPWLRRNGIPAPTDRPSDRQDSRRVTRFHGTPDSEMLASFLLPPSWMVRLATQTRNIFSAQSGLRGSSREDLLVAFTALVDAALIAGCEIPHIHVWTDRELTVRVTGRIPE